MLARSRQPASQRAAPRSHDRCGQASHPVVQDNQSCEGQASSGLDRATCPASGVARRRAPQLLSTYKNSRKAKRIATCSTRLRYDNNNTTSRNQNTTIPEDGNILQHTRTHAPLPYPWPLSPSVDEVGVLAVITAHIELCA